jgi:SAM-dependent methyltransferase
LQLKIFIKKVVKAMMPYGVLELYWRNEIKKLYGNDPASYCPVCGKTSYFKPFGNPPRQKSYCIHCGSVERHRLSWLFFRKKTNLFDKTEKKILHVAAEPCFESRLKKMFKKNYITADLYNPDAMVKMDITDIGYPDESFDIVICNHVLEHVSNDIKAMGEFHRVLKKNGWAILLVPIADIDITYEDFSITTEVGRLRAFGQGDHVRKYGRDYIGRLKSAGFNVTVVTSDELASEDEIKRMCLNENSEIWGFASTEIFYCTK